VSRQLTWAVIVDGGTDSVLVPIIRWAIHRLDPEVEILEPEFRRRSGGVAEFFETYKSSAMLIFVHRDAENLTLDARMSEFDSVSRPDVVAVVPVRMSEAWILFDGSAIAKAAGSPSVHVPVPELSEIEGIAEPKDHLERLLFEAAGSPTGRRGKVFKRSLVARRVSVAGHIGDFSPLEGLSAFQRFQSALAERYPYSEHIPQP
jgi:hypothetical protein